MAGNRPEERVRPVALRQKWRHVCFLHWRYRPEALSGFLPPGLRLDLVDGSAWVGLTPFLVRSARVTGMPPVPGAATFAETNLRLYVRDGEGTDGIWFLSLDVGSVPVALAARAITGLPYFPGAMTVTVGDTVGYQARRFDRRPASHRIEVRPLARARADHLAELLIGRWRAFGRRHRSLFLIPATHRPWRIQAAEVIQLDETFLAAAGLPPPTGDPLAHYAEGVDARFGLPRPLGAAMPGRAPRRWTLPRRRARGAAPGAD